MFSGRILTVTVANFETLPMLKGPPHDPENPAMSDKVLSASMGMGTGLHDASDAIEFAKHAPTADEKIRYLTEAVEILVAHIKHGETEARMEKMNREMGNV
jgi:hypothetical protein